MGEKEAGKPAIEMLSFSEQTAAFTRVAVGGAAATIAGDAQQKILTLPGVEDASVEIVWDPIWNPRMISEAGRKQLGLE